jgi:LCP family protein required for cell wall assembly
MGLGRRLRGVSIGLALLMTGSGALAGPVSAASFHFNPLPWLELGDAMLNNVLPGGALLGSVVGPTSLSYGSDGRLTVLLVGSDYRPRLAGTGERTDTIMVVSINPKTHATVAVSIPRDVAKVPIGPGQIYKGRINSLFKAYKKAYGTREAAMEHLRQAIAYALQIQIDYVAYIRFTGVEALVSKVGGVPVAVKKTIYDNRIVDDRVSNHPHGAKFLQSTSTLMVGADAPWCWGPGTSGNWAAVPNCRRALLYVRSRHGPGNSDWARAKRQQFFVMAAVQRVISQNGSSQSALYALASAARGMPSDFYTTLPIATNGDVYALFNLLRYASLSNFQHAVFKPHKYAYTVRSHQELRLSVVRALCAEWFAPVH